MCGIGLFNLEGAREHPQESYITVIARKAKG